MSSFPGDLDIAGFGNLSTQMEQILQAVNGVKLEMKALRTEMVSFKAELRTEIAVSFEEMRGELASFKSDTREELDQFKVAVKRECVDSIKHECQQVNKAKQSQDDKLKWMAIEGEARSKRNNLLFHGLKETKEENCEEVLLDFIRKELKLDSTVVLQRVHRLGAPKSGTNIGRSAIKPRPIIANFLDFKQRELVRSKRFGLRDPHGISEDLPVAVREARRELLAEFKELKKAKKNMGIVWPAKLLCEREIIRVVDPVKYFGK